MELTKTTKISLAISFLILAVAILFSSKTFLASLKLKSSSLPAGIVTKFVKPTPTADLLLQPKNEGEFSLILRTSSTFNLSGLAARIFVSPSPKTVSLESSPLAAAAGFSFPVLSATTEADANRWRLEISLLRLPQTTGQKQTIKELEIAIVKVESNALPSFTFDPSVTEAFGEGGQVIKLNLIPYGN